MREKRRVFSTKKIENGKNSLKNYKLLAVFINNWRDLIKSI